jgi:hypothetical protein
MKILNFHRSLTIAALLAAVAAPLTAAAAPSGSSGASSAGGSGHASNGGFGAAPQLGGGTLMRPSGGGTLMRPSGGEPSMRPSGGGTLTRPSGGDPSMLQRGWNAAASSDRKRWRYIYPDNDSMLLGKQAPCNTVLWPPWLHPAFATNVYGPILASCAWQRQPLWLWLP